MPDSLADIRRRYAEQVTAAAPWPPIREAFAAVRRERFLFPGPWQLPNLQGGPPDITPDADPRHVYQDRLIALDPAKNLNNGVPSFWAGLFQLLQPKHGERAIHAGAGTGYYTAVLAELVGPQGSVVGIEYEAALAAHARSAFEGRPNVEILQGDALALAHGAADVIVASAGLDQVPLPWLMLLRDGGRLLVPLTAPSPLYGERIGVGAFLLITRRGSAFDARFVGATGIYHFMASRSVAAGARLRQAFGLEGAGPGWRPPRIAALHIGADADESAWLAGDGWWLSTKPNP